MKKRNKGEKIGSKFKRRGEKIEEMKFEKKIEKGGEIEKEGNGEVMKEEKVGEGE